MSFKNGEINNRKGFGWKAICLTDSYKPLEITHTIHNGPPEIRGSYQARPKIGQFVFKVVWKIDKTGIREEKYQVFTVSSIVKGEIKLTQIPITEAGQFWKVAESTNSWMNDWLQPMTEWGVFLPPAAGPVLSNQRKWNNWMHFMKKFGEMHQYASFDSMSYGPRYCVEFSPGKGLNYLPRKLDFDPDTVAIPDAEDEDDLNLQFKRTQYFLSDGTGHMFEACLPEGKTVGIHGWRSRRYVIRLITGAYNSMRDNQPRTHGVKIDVYYTSDAK